jgi:hypothetical protein
MHVCMECKFRWAAGCTGCPLPFTMVEAQLQCTRKRLSEPEYVEFDKRLKSIKATQPSRRKFSTREGT